MVRPVEKELPAELVQELGKKLVDPTINLPERYRVLFSLRNAAGEEATRLLVAALRRTDLGNLFRHDVAFCLGQRQDVVAFEALKVRSQCIITSPIHAAPSYSSIHRSDSSCPC